MLIDSHAHLSDGRFDADRADVIARCKQEGIARIVEIGAGYGLDGALKSREIAESEEIIYFAAGLHPHDAKLLTDELWGTLESLCTHPKAVGIGETGLDYYYKHSTPEQQQAVLRRCVDLARRRRLPLVIHDRDAHEETFRILEEERAFEREGEFHCFSGDWSFARRVLDKGWMIALGGVVTFPRAQDLHEVARRVPLDQLLLETDSPYLTPVPHRGKRNEPWMTCFVARKVAELQGVSIEKVIEVTGANAIRLFGLGLR